MQYQWQLWIGCALFSIVSLAYVNQHGSPVTVTAASFNNVSRRSDQAINHITNRIGEQRSGSGSARHSASNPDTPTIIGGKEAVPGAWPWMVALMYANSTDAAQGQFCGGALIDAQWVLSAAHCTFDLSGRPRQPAEIDIVIGRHQLSSTNGQQIRITQIVRHPAYAENTFNNDLALLQLATPVNYAPLHLFAIQQRAKEQSGTAATVIGWGVTEQGHDSDVLRQVEVPLVDLATCRQSYGIFNEKVTENMLCAGLRDGGKDSCQGDSGGPMMVFDEGRQQWQQVGIVSWGEGCAEPNYYGVYTRVSNYVEWIHEQVPNLQSPTPTSTPQPTPTSTPQAMHTATSTLIPTTISTRSATPTSTLSPTAVATPPENTIGYKLYLPVIAMQQVFPLRNGTFESGGGQGWSEYSLQKQSLVVPVTSNGAPTRSGQYIAHLGDHSSEVAFIQQVVTISKSVPILEYWTIVNSSDDCGYDFAGVVVDNQVIDQFDLCRSTAVSEWQRRQVDLRAYGGETVSLELRAETDGFLDSTVLIDDVAFVPAIAPDQLTSSSSRPNGQQSTRTSPTTRFWPASQRRR